VIFTAMLVGAAFAALPAPTAASSASALAPAAAVGRLVFKDGKAAMSVKDVRRTVGGKRIGLELRNGWNVVSARVEDDGFFVAEGPPGEYVLEYVTVGDGAEFLPAPQQVNLRAGEVACAGTIELAYRDLPAELGQNAGGAVTVTDRCADLGSRAASVAGGRSVRTRIAAPVAAPRGQRSGWEIVSAPRVGGDWSGSGGVTRTFWTVQLAVGLTAPISTRGAIFAIGSAGQGNVDEVSGGTSKFAVYSGGLGWDPTGATELSAGVEWHGSTPASKGGPSGFASFRFGNHGFGIGLRGTAGTDARTLGITVDCAPLVLLGGLL
jgi:hypothetical protein